MTLWKILLYIVVGSHYILFLALVFSMPFLAIYEPWYVSVPVIIWVLNLMTLPVKCFLTTLENWVRTRAGLPTIKGFVSRWILFRSEDNDRPNT